MTLKEAIEYWELFNSEIDDLLLLYRSNSASVEALEKQREAVEFTIAALRQMEVRHERWEKRGSKWQCTGCKVLMSIDGTPQENLLYYCPNCGAKMDKEK